MNGTTKTLMVGMSWCEGWLIEGLSTKKTANNIVSNDEIILDGMVYLYPRRGSAGLGKKRRRNPAAVHCWMTCWDMRDESRRKRDQERDARRNLDTDSSYITSSAYQK